MYILTLILLTCSLCTGEYVRTGVPSSVGSHIWPRIPCIIEPRIPSCVVSPQMMTEERHQEIYQYVYNKEEEKRGQLYAYKRTGDNWIMTSIGVTDNSNRGGNNWIWTRPGGAIAIRNQDIHPLFKGSAWYEVWYIYTPIIFCVLLWLAENIEFSKGEEEDDEEDGDWDDYVLPSR